MTTGAREGGLAAAGRNVGVWMVLELEERWPEFAAQVRAMEKEIRADTAHLLRADGWARCLAVSVPSDKPLSITKRL